MSRTAFVICALLSAVIVARPDPGQTHVVYKVTVKADGPRHYFFSVEVTNPNQDELVFIVPHWAPGAYREITVGARGGKPSWEQLEGFHAADEKGKKRRVKADGQRRWRVDSKGARKITFSYANTAPGSPTNNRSYLGANSGLIDGPRNWMYVEGKKGLPLHVHFDLPDGWEVGSGLDPTFDPKVFTAKDYDRLADCPTLVGKMKSWTFLVRGVPHRVVADAGRREPRVQEKEFLDTVERIVRVYVDLFDDVPYDHYTFIYTPGGGGLEHLTSTTIGGVQRLTGRGLMGVTAHEFFHTWNVKRLRPKRLGPFDYTGPQPVNDLWIAEGITSYYTPLGLWRAGLYQDEEFLQRQAGGIRSWEGNPAHLTQSPEESSRAVWTGGTRISYYLQGQVLGMMIDLLIRERSDNRWSFDDVMRLMYAKYGGYYRWTPSKPGYESGDWPREIKELTGVDVSEFWASHIQESVPVEWNKYLRSAGWELAITDRPLPSLSSFRTRRDGRLRRLIIAEGGPAHVAGFRDGDILTKVNGRTVSRFGASRAFSRLEIGSEWTAEVRRGEESVTLNGVLSVANDFGALTLAPAAGGLKIGEVLRGSSVWNGGVRDDDLLIAVDGKPTRGAGVELADLLGKKAGETVTLRVKRGDAEHDCKITTANRKTIRVGRMKIHAQITDRQRRIRDGMKTGKTQR
ncbi:MAG: hypothetical protein CMJ83_12680 [Planctomycetes bacterium]|nr:hypothetical protein [Planctomycetota bacterium]